MSEFKFSTIGLRARGVGRVGDNPRALLVLLTDIPGDDDIRALHDIVVHRPASDEARFEHYVCEPLTAYRFTMFAARLAQKASSWGADTVAVQEADSTIRPDALSRFLSEMRSLLLHMERHPPGSDDTDA